MTTAHVGAEKLSRPKSVFWPQAWLAIVSIIAFLPVLLFLFAGIDFTTIASESLAYRFFYSVRLYMGPDRTAWLPQGQLLNAIQHVINLAILPTLDGTIPNLHAFMNLFACLTLAVVGAVFVVAFWIAFRAPHGTWRDKILLTVVAFAPTYTSVGVVWTFYPDYLILDIALTTLAVALFQRQWHAEGGRHTYLLAAAAGAFVGAFAANKISMLLVGAPLVVAILFTAPVTPLEVLRRGALAALSAVVALSFIVLAAALFRIGWLHAIWKPWLAFVANPGGDEGFWTQIFGYLASGYGVMIAWWAIALVLAIATGASDKSMRRFAVLATIIVASTACFVSIWKRPAGTTFGESCGQLLAFGAMCMTMVRRQAIEIAATVALVAFLCAGAVAKRSDKTLTSLIFYSRAVAKEEWAFFVQATSNPPPSGIRYFLPENRYQFGDFFIMLLKGASDFPTWTISENGQRLIDRYAPGLKFVTDYNHDHDDLRGARLVWVDAHWSVSPIEGFKEAGLQKIPERYPDLAAATRLTPAQDVPLPVSDVTAHILQMPRDASTPGPTH